MVGETAKKDEKTKVKLTYEITKETDDRFRMAVARAKGLHKGVLGESLEEAIIKWVEERERIEKQNEKRKP